MGTFASQQCCPWTRPRRAGILPPMRTNEKYDYGRLFRRLWRYYKPYKWILFTDLLAVAAGAAFGLAVPYLLKILVDRAVPSRDLGALLAVAASVAVLALARYAANYYSLYMGHALAARMERDMRRDLFRKIEGMSFSFFDERKTGELMSRMINDVGKVSDAVNHAPEDLLLAAFTIAGSYAVLFSLHPPLEIGRASCRERVFSSV